MLIRHPPIALGWLLLLASCESEGPLNRESAVALAESSLWNEANPSQDPFDDRPAFVECPPEALTLEFVNGDEAVEVTTGVCNYLALTQPLLFEVKRGDHVDFRVWHFELKAPEAAQAHVGVAIDGEVVWDEWREIPSLGGLLTSSWTADRDIPAGADVVFHLHNHGLNTWLLFPPTRRIPQ